MNREELAVLYDNSFMKPDIAQGKFWHIDTARGCWVVPVHVCGIGKKFSVGMKLDEDVELGAEDAQFRTDVFDTLKPYADGEINEAKLLEGWYGRLSAPGYMDCTEWNSFDSEEEAITYYAEQVEE